MWSGREPSCEGRSIIHVLTTCAPVMSLTPLFISTAIRCSSLSLDNGIVEYTPSTDGSGLFSGDFSGSGLFGDPDTLSQYDYETIATHKCNTGFVLTVGDVERTCGDGNGVNGEWSGTAPVCQCMWYKKSYLQCLT